MFGRSLQNRAHVNAQGEHSNTPLSSACSRGYSKIVKLLLQNGADVNPQGTHSHTRLSSACSGGDIKVVELLLQNGADVNAQGEDPETPLHSACSRDDIKIVELLLQKGAHVNARASISALPFTQRVGVLMTLLLQMGADINLQAEHEDSEDSFTPLHTACYCVHAATVELLLQKDMDLQVAARGKSFNTALHFASGQGHLDVMKLLLEKRADPYFQNKDLRTPLDLARDAGHDEIVAAFSVASSTLS